MTNRKRLLFAAPLSGDAAGTKTTAEAMQRLFTALGSFEVTPFDIAFSFEERRAKLYPLRRMGRLVDFVRTAVGAPKGAGRTAYLVADGGKGFYFTLVQLLALRLAGYRTIVSLRSFRLLRENPGLLALASKVGGPQVTFMSLCSTMTAAVKAAMPGVATFECSNIVHHVPPPTEDVAPRAGKLKIGFVSNLIPGKGVDVFLKIAERLAGNEAFEFVVAGYARDAAYFAEIGELKQPWITWVGGVSGEAKEALFRDLDVFVFPTTYPDEAQPNIVFELAAHGAHVISTDISCLSGDVAELGGSALAIEGFVDAVEVLMTKPGFVAEVAEGRAARIERYRAMRDRARASAEAAIREVLDANA